MTLAIGFERPPQPVRERITRSVARMVRLELADPHVRELAALRANPAVLGSGLKAAALAGGGMADARLAIASVMQVIGQGAVLERSGTDVYDPALASSQHDLAELAAQLPADLSTRRLRRRRPPCASTA